MSLWMKCVSRLKAQLSSTEFGLWIQPLQAECYEDGIEVYAPNSFVLKFVKKNYLDNIIQALGDSSGITSPRLSFSVGSSRSSPHDLEVSPALPTSDRPLAPYGAERRLKAQACTPESRISRAYWKHSGTQGAPKQERRLNLKNTFSAFVKGECNQLALAAAQKVADTPGKTYNPLFLFGRTGLGKTHLLHAIGNAILTSRPTAKLAYVHSERFVQNMIAALQRNGAEQFKRQYRSLDVLLLDDVQFFCNKLRSQEEFFYTFNELLDEGQQIVLAADRAPHYLPIEERLKSRLSSGLSVELKVPALKTRTSILLKKAEEQKTNLPEEVALLMAERMGSNVRELEGALIRVAASANFQSCPITRQFVDSVLKGVCMPKASELKIELVQQLVAEHYKLPIDSLLARTRSRSVARPRQVAMALTKELSQFSLSEIGRAFGGRDHTTVLHACRQVAQRCKEDRGFYLAWAQLRQSLL